MVGVGARTDWGRLAPPGADTPKRPVIVRPPPARRSASRSTGRSVESFGGRPSVDRTSGSGWTDSVRFLATNDVETVRAAAAPFDLILMDLQMPILDGITATRRLRAAGWTAPIVALTATASPDDLAALRAAGYDDHLSKPVTEAVLLALLGRSVR